MVDFLLGLLMVACLGLLAWGVWDALRLMAAHMRDNPQAVSAIVEHVFMPLFADKKEPERMVPNASEEKSSDRN